MTLLVFQRFGFWSLGLFLVVLAGVAAQGLADRALAHTPHTADLPAQAPDQADLNPAEQPDERALPGKAEQAAADLQEKIKDQEIGPKQTQQRPNANQDKAENQGQPSGPASPSVQTQLFHPMNEPAGEPPDLTPPITIELNQDPENLAGTVNVRLKAEGAKEVRLLRKKPKSLVSTYLGTMRQISSGEFRFLWPTVNTPNGEHIIFAEVTNQFGTYSGGEIKVRVNNPAKSIEPQVIRRQAQEKARQLFGLEKGEEAGKQGQAPKIPEKRLAEKIREQLIEKGIIAPSSKSAAPKAVERGEEGLEQAQGQVEEKPTVEVAERALEEVRAKQQKRIQKIREFFSDLDQDGLTDADEKRFGSDPLNPDTDGDGVLDGLQVLAGYDPTRPIPSTKPIVFEQPTEPNSGEVNDLDWQVTGAELDQETGFVTLKGKALPNTIVVLYIYSRQPIIVTVKADSLGNWTYTLDRELAAGEHEVYVAITDNQGKILEKSSPLRFVLEAGAIRVLAAEEQVAPASVQSGLAQQEAFVDRLLIVVLLVVASLILVLLIIVFLAKQQRF